MWGLAGYARGLADGREGEKGGQSGYGAVVSGRVLSKIISIAISGHILRTRVLD